VQIVFSDNSVRSAVLIIKLVFLKINAVKAMEAVSVNDLEAATVKFQQVEINQHEVYSKLSRKAKGNNSEVLKRIAEDELEHYYFWRKYTGKELKPEKSSVLKYDFLSFIFGFTFSIKLMESKEKKAQKEYALISKRIPEAQEYLHEEERHEASLIEIIDEKRLSYLGVIISGLNDAWIELIGELAGFTFAFQDPRLIGFAGLIAGIAQFLSSSASEIQIFLSKRNEETENALKGSLFEGVIYLLTVGLLISPYFALSNYWLALAITISTALIIITFFTYYNSVVRSVSFRSMFPSMIGITVAVGAAAFAIGLIAKMILNL
jgi:VIT1/CCC1 family predicted Fe2+/Mn2+ transporter